MRARAAAAAVDIKNNTQICASNLNLKKNYVALQDTKIIMSELTHLCYFSI